MAQLEDDCVSEEAYYLVYPKSHAKIERVNLFRTWLMEMLGEHKQAAPRTPARTASTGKAA